MTDDASRHLDALLKSLGFQERKQRTTSHWQIDLERQGDHATVVQRQSTIRIVSIHKTWNEDAVIEDLREQLVHHWGRNISIWHQVRESGTLAVMVEILPPPSPSKRAQPRIHPPAVVGWTVRIVGNDDSIRLYIDDHVVLGQVPEFWLADLTHASIKTFFGKNARLAATDSIYECSIPTLAAILCNSKAKGHLDDLRAIADEAKFTQGASLQLNWDDTKRAWTASSAREEDARTQHAGQTEPTMNALESRASKDLVQSYDQALLSRRDFSEALRGNQPAVVSRLIIDSLHGRTDQSELLSQLYKSDEQTWSHFATLLASGRLKSLMDQESWDDAFDALRQWRDTVAHIYDEAEEISSLSVAIPEFAGVILSHFNPDMALLAFERAQDRGDNPRILAWMANLLLPLHKLPEELEVLGRWLPLEKRQEESKAILERMALIQVTLGEPNAALAHLEQLLAKKHTPTHSWLEIVDRVADLGQPKKALDLLDRFEKIVTSQPKSSMEKLFMAINHTIARIWIDVLNRPDLAAGRLTTILNNPQLCSLSEIEEAESALVQSGDTKAAFTSRERRWQSYTAEERSRHHELGIQIMEYYKDKSDFKNEFRIASELLAVGHLPESLDQRIPMWLHLSLEWRPFIVSAQSIMKSTSLPAKTVISLARIVREKLGDHSLALEFMTYQDTAKELTDADFSYVVDRLGFQRDKARAAQVIVSRLSSSDPSVKQNTLILAVRAGVKDHEGMIHEGLCDAWSKDSDQLLIVERMSHLLRENDREHLLNLTSKIVELLADKQDFKLLLDAMIDLLRSQSSILATETSKPLIKASVEASGHSVESLQNAIGFHVAKRDLESTVPYIRELVDLGVQPDIAQSTAERLLAGDTRSLASLALMQLKSSPREHQVIYARQGIQHLTALGEWGKEMSECFQALLQHQAFVESDLSDLRKVCDSTEDHRLLVDGLRQVAQTSEKAIEGAKFLDDAVEIAIKNLDDPKLAFELATESMRVLPSTKKRLIAAKLALAAGDDEFASQTCATFLREPECLDSPEFLMEACEILIAAKDARLLTSNIVQTLISWSETSGNEPLTHALIRFAIQNSIATKSILQKEIINALTRDSMDDAAFSMTRLIQRAELQRESVSSILDQLLSDITKAGFEDVWWQLIGLMTNEERLLRFSASARHEILLRYGMWLYSLENRHDESLRILLDLQNEQPNEQRIWVPLYILLEDLGSDEQLLKHLEMTIPKIERNPSVLDPYPIHIESMKTSLSKVRARASNQNGEKETRQAIRVARGIATSDSQQHRSDRVAAMQSSLLSAIPKISLEPEVAIASEDGNGALQLQPIIDEPLKFEPISTKELQIVSLTDNAPEEKIAAHNADKEVFSNDPTLVGNRLDWRSMALSLEAPDDACQRIMRTAFANETEKHLALQVSALLTGNFAALDSWHWRCWRDPQEFGYSLSSTGRMPQSTDLSLINAPLYKFLMTFSPIVARSIRGRLGIDSVIRKKQPNAKMLMKRLIPTHAAITRTGLLHVAEKLTTDKFVFIDTPEIGSDVFLDAASRSIHFSSTACLLKPPGYLMHRVRFLTFALMANQFVLLQAKVDSEIMPLIAQLTKLKESSPIERVRLAFNIESAKFQRNMHGLDVNKIHTLKKLAEPFDAAQVSRLQTELQMHNFRIQLAGSLDLIGLFEAIIGDSITDLSKEAIKNRIESSAILRDLISFTTKIIL